MDKNLNASVERVQQFYEFLQGRLPEGVIIANAPKMAAADAFSVIWFLQEITEVIPASIESCAYCGQLFDSDLEGHLGDTPDRFYCSPMCEFSDGKSTSDANGDQGE